jgi:hypothetical protein
MYLVLLPPILTILSGDFSITVALLRVALGIQALTNTVVQLPFDYFADQYDVAVAFYAVAAVAVLATVLILAMVPRLDGESRPVPLTGE